MMKAMPRRAVLRRKLRTAVTRFQPWQTAYAGPLFLLSGLFRLAVLTLPFRWLSPVLGRHCGNSALSMLAKPEEEQQAWQCGRIIKAVCKHTPWESKCLIQALLAAVMLRARRIPYAVFLGLARTDGPGSKLEAHAWVSAGRYFVTGGNGHLSFAVVAVYVHKPQRRR